MPLINLSPAEVLECKTFCLESAKSQQTIEFGNKKTKSRPVLEVARDNAIGKLAEAAFCRFANEKWKINLKPDYNIYPRGQWDDSDFMINHKRFDIKATRTGGNWLLVEFSKLEFRVKEGKLPHYFVFCVTSWNRETGKFTGDVEICGYISLHDLMNSKVLFEKECIPETNVKLQTKNYAVHRTELKTDWNNLWISNSQSAQLMKAIT